MTKPKILVIGIDGATWDLIKNWAEKGELPTFRELISNGSWGELESSIPPVSVPAWKCYSTGKNPGKLGVFYWVDVDKRQGKIVIPQKSFENEELWDYLGKNGFRVGVINVPSARPRRVNGFIIAGNPAGDEDEYTFPKGLKIDLISEFNYRINPKGLIHVYGKSVLEEIKELIKIRFEVAKKYLFAVDFLNLAIYYTDFVMHYFWNDKSEILEIFKLIDEGIFELKDLLERMDEFTLFLMSDHGFEGLKDTFYINDWLSEKGYLTKKKGHPIFSKVGLNQAFLIGVAKKIKLLPKITNLVLSKKLYDKIMRALPLKMGIYHIDAMDKVIDFKKSLVIALKEGPIYINEHVLPGEEYEKLREKVIRELKNIKHPETKEAIFKEVFKKEDIYSGRYLGGAPDLVFLTSEGYDVDPSLSLLQKDLPHWDRYRSPQHKVLFKWNGHHNMEGLFLAYGTHIKKARLKGARIYDLAPTILHIAGIPIPRDLDGKVLKEIFKLNSEPAKKPIEYVKNLKETKKAQTFEREESMIKERLKTLGYLG